MKTGRVCFEPSEGKNDCVLCRTLTSRWRRQQWCRVLFGKNGENWSSNSEKIKTPYRWDWLKTGSTHFKMVSYNSYSARWIEVETIWTTSRWSALILLSTSWIGSGTQWPTFVRWLTCSANRNHQERHWPTSDSGLSFTMPMPLDNVLSNIVHFLLSLWENK